MKKERIVIHMPMRIKKPCPKNPKVGIHEEHYAWLCDLACRSGKPCAAINNAIYDYIRANVEVAIAEVTIGEREE